MNIYFWIAIWLLISLVFGIGFFVGEYFADNVPPGSNTPIEKIIVFLLSPGLAAIWLYIRIKQIFLGRKLK